jgi:hypothetical protein
MRKVVGRHSRKAAPAIAAKISSEAAISRNGELLFRPAEATLAFEPSDTDMLLPTYL